MKSIHDLKNSLNERFIDIVGMIQTLIELRSANFASMLEINDVIEGEASKFMDDTMRVINDIASSLGKKIHEIDIVGMKFEIDESTDTFLQITDDLELLSYNTICRTMSLGVKGATIAHISKEIKNFSETAKELMSDVSQIFTDIYNEFNSINNSFLQKKDYVDEINVESSGGESELEINSDLSVLIENSQFHDIIIQELDTVFDAVGVCECNHLFGKAQCLGVLEIAHSKIYNIKDETENVFLNIRGVISEFIYNVNTDIQNMVSRANLVKMDFYQARDYSEEISGMINELLEMIDRAKVNISKAQSGVDQLGKFSKNFRNLLVITSIEVARIGDSSLESVVISMANTEKVLGELINKLSNSLSTWVDLKDGFSSVLKLAEGDMQKLNELHGEGQINSVIDKAEELDKELQGFRDIFDGNRYINAINSGVKDSRILYEKLAKDIENEIEHINKGLTPQMKEDPEFINGYSSAEIKDIKASEDDMSSIEFF